MTLDFGDDRVAVDITDDGVGFDPGSVPEPAPESGFGLAAMRARVDDLGGTFTVRSAEGEGTSITAVLPLPSESSSERHL
ncbi:sensor histidine kinase [Rhodococcus sp. NPDC058639]|uniref:sensor histidine kinase n=1 Tax=Rhodococcus sp. NPDC058639 TaxID=3346570 RepID=UPI00364D20B1